MNNVPHVGNGWEGQRGGGGSQATIVLESGSCGIHRCSVSLVVIVLVVAVVNKFVVVGLVLLNDAWLCRKERN